MSKQDPGQDGNWGKQASETRILPPARGDLILNRAREIRAEAINDRHRRIIIPEPGAWAPCLMVTIMDQYNPSAIEAKWQDRWEAGECFVADNNSDKPKYYVLEMFPYPSGRIHMGHVRNYTLGDLVARFRRAQGLNVLHPMGWDAFGLPAENAAMERGVHPGKWTIENISAMRAQLRGMGLSYDWDRELATCTPDYYQHEQRMFLKFMEQGLAYRKESWVNWDPVENTVLANEQVVDGCGWRSGAPVERRLLSQWFLKITEYADDLLDAIEGLDRWPDRVRLMQQNWIGRSEGARVRFAICGDIAEDIAAETDNIEVFTTRPDTLYGASFVAVAANHPLAIAVAEGQCGGDGVPCRMRQARHVGSSCGNRREKGF